MIEEKTRGNLSGPLHRFITQTLQDLRLNFVDETQRARAAANGSPDESDAESGDTPQG